MVNVIKPLPNGSDAIMADKQSRFIAEAVSIITNPALMFVASLAYITYHYADTAQQASLWTAIGTLLLVGPGMAYTLLTWRKKHHVDIDITKREDRIVPLMLASLGALFGSYLVFSRLDNPRLYLMSVILVALLVCITIITSQWKISLHNTTFAALTTLLVIFGSPYFAFLYLLLAGVGWARIYLKQHTVAQVVGGALLGSALTVAMALLFRS